MPAEPVYALRLSVPSSLVVKLNWARTATGSRTSNNTSRNHEGQADPAAGRPFVDAFQAIIHTPERNAANCRLSKGETRCDPKILDKPETFEYKANTNTN